jgi:hypothetical protein
VSAEFVLVGGQVIYNVHPADRCHGQRCTIHNPSNHHMRAWVQTWDGFDMYRWCPHHAPHPDPDDNNYGFLHECKCQCCEWTPEKAAQEIALFLAPDGSPDDRERFARLTSVDPLEGADLRPVDP